jgi:hypothetical protein
MEAFSRKMMRAATPGRFIINHREHGGKVKETLIQIVCCEERSDLFLKFDTICSLLSSVAEAVLVERIRQPGDAFADRSNGHGRSGVVNHRGRREHRAWYSVWRLSQRSDTEADTRKSLSR